jgi:hypothetical protein
MQKYSSAASTRLRHTAISLLPVPTQTRGKSGHGARPGSWVSTMWTGWGSGRCVGHATGLGVSLRSTPHEVGQPGAPSSFTDIGIA